MKNYREILSTYEFDKPIVIDCETISYDDNRGGLRPYHGDRVAMFAFYQEGKQPVSICVRHRNDAEKHRMVDLDEGLQFVREFAYKVKDLVNANVKFDLRFMAQDLIFFKHATVRDTQVLARLVNNEHTSLSLDNLTKFYGVAQKKGSLIDTWLKQNNTKDYGRVPIDILSEYAIGDVVATWELYKLLLSKLPEESKSHWETECRFTKLLFDCEDNGIAIDKRFFMKKRVELLQSIITVSKKISELGGDTFNPASYAQKVAWFNKRNVQPIKLSEKGAPSWDADALAMVNEIEHGKEPYNMAKLLMNLSELSICESTFCAGWLGHADPNGIVHPDFRQAGTASGRLSCGEPNAQNFPEWAKEGFIINPGYVGIKWDLSQIEYRLFSHYAKNARILEAYAKDPNTDYHQILADILGFPRKPTKTINFGMLYGMGKKKLTNSLISAIAEYDSVELRKALSKFCTNIPEYPEPIDIGTARTIAENVLATYHNNLPEIRALIDQIKRTLRTRGYIRNFYGRRIHLPVEMSYIGLNYLIQGGAADFFKTKLVELHSAVPEAYIIDNVHDADFSIIAIEHAQKYWNACKEIVEKSPFIVPIRIDGEVAIGRWSNSAPIINNNIKESMDAIANRAA